MPWKNLTTEKISVLFIKRFYDKDLGNKKFMTRDVFFQIPCFETRNDGLDNIIGALILAGNLDNIIFVESLHTTAVHNRLL